MGDRDAGDHRVRPADRLSEPFEVTVDAAADEGLILSYWKDIQRIQPLDEAIERVLAAHLVKPLVTSATGEPQRIVLPCLHGLLRDGLDEVGLIRE